MGAGAITAAVREARQDELRSAFVSLLPEQREKLQVALGSSGTPEAPTKSYTLVYHGAMAKFLGRGWSPMMILEESGATYECKAPEDRPPTTFAPPMVITPSGAKVSQVAVCCMALGKELGMWPEDLKSDMKAAQFLADAADMVSDSGKKDAQRMAKWFSHLEKGLELSGGPFFFGEKLTAADYGIFASVAMATQEEEMAAELKKCGKLSAFQAKMKEQKGYRAVDAKGLPLMPGPSAPVPTKKYTLVYHGAMAKFLGRGWSPMMILEEGGAAYECKAPEDRPPTTFAPPMVITPSGAKVSQVAVCCMALGKELDLWPKDLKSDMKAAQFLADAADMFSDSGKKDAQRMAKWFNHLEKGLELSGGPFFFGEKLTAADYGIFASVVMSTQQEEIAAELKKCEKLSAFQAKMKEQKGYKAVDAKGLPLMP